MFVKQIYPRPDKPVKGQGRPWRVDYNLAYDGGGGRWSGFTIQKLLHILQHGGIITQHGGIITLPHGEAAQNFIGME